MDTTEDDVVVIVVTGVMASNSFEIDVLFNYISKGRQRPLHDVNDGYQPV